MSKRIGLLTQRDPHRRAGQIECFPQRVGEIAQVGSRHGVGGLEPLHNRISFSKNGENGEYVNVRQPQLELRPFNEERLRAVAKSLRNLYPATDRERFLAKLDDAIPAIEAEAFKRSLSPLDILFAVLAVLSAFKLGSGDLSGGGED